MNRLRKFFQVVFFPLVFMLAQPVHSTPLSIAQQPLLLGGMIAPNIMFILDDSGSMQWESLPDYGLFDYLYPLAEGVYGGDEYSNYVPEFTDDASYNVRVRSHHANKLYYNPETTYTPWVNSDGSSMPDANPACAWHNPMDTSGSVGLGRGDCRNLTASNTQSASWETYDGPEAGLRTVLGNSRITASDRTFWPAVYYQYDDSCGDDWDKDCYTPVEIRPGTASYTDGDRSNRTDCAGAANNTCTYAEEIQNFANWYTYYRSRILLARNGVGKAFAAQGTGLRVGFAAINQGSADIDGFASPGALVTGLRLFSDGDPAQSNDDFRTAFFNELYNHPIPTEGTPLRRSLDAVGQYYQWDDNRGPWGKVPGTDDASAHLECRQSYAILMTDGYWNGGPARTEGARGNVDNQDGPSIDGAAGNNYQYTPSHPYSDDNAGSLADVAMYFWNHDLQPELANAVPTNVQDEAFWQHMVTYTVGLGVNGTLDPASDLSALASGEQSWPDIPDGGNTPEAVDDLWHAAINGRGGYFSAANPDEFADRLQGALTSIGQRISSAAAIATNTTRLNSSTFVYQARFDPNDWHGQLLAYPIDASNGEVVSDPSWDAGTVMPAAGSRNILTYDSDAGAGIPFTWDSLSTDKRAQLDPNSDGLGEARLAWLRGDPSNEQRNSGVLRNRPNGSLGDIVNSDPWRVGQENYGYHILPGTEGSSYLDYRASDSYRHRSKVLYVGANDGMLHAFDVGTWNPDRTNNPGFEQGTGVEKFAYVPEALFPDLYKLTDPDYRHQYYVDGPSRASDAYIGGAWKTVLVGTTGAGGKAVFALDVTDPDNMDASKVLWELSDASSDTLDANGVSMLGYTLGQPTVARMYNGHWAAIFGNGYNSAAGRAVLFIKDLEDGTVFKLDTGSGDPTNKNGLSTPTAIDNNNDGIVDAIYAGDLFGNLWKFDVSDVPNGNSDPAWGVAYRQGHTPVPLFTAQDGNGNAQPITGKVEVGKHPSGGVMVYFGTGKYIELSDVTSTDVQTLYGIWDDDQTVSGRSALAAQEIVAEFTDEFEQADGTTSNPNVRITTSNPVNYSSDEDPDDPTNLPDRRGWYMDLVTPLLDSDGQPTGSFHEAGERVVSVPILHDSRVLFTTMIPDPDPCSGGGTSWNMDLTAIDGSQPAVSPFDLNNDGSFDINDYSNSLPWNPDGRDVVSGTQSNVGITKTPAIIRVGDREYRYAGGSEGGIEKTTGARSTKTGRQSWWQVR